jgi:release factor glutamine methyltransferase
MTIGEALRDIQKRLLNVGIDNARFEARMLICAAMDIETQILIAYPERIIDQDQQDKLEALIKRREAREPMSHILGQREFWSLDFFVTKDTLTPRADSETLIEAALKHIPDQGRDLHILDLGLGTGCLLLTLLHEYPNASGLGIDISPPALKVAQKNAKHLGLESRCSLRLGNWDEGIEDEFDLIISNPPYIPETDKTILEPEVLDHEPHQALFAGVDGLDDYKRLSHSFVKLLSDEGLAILELGIHQSEPVSEIMRKAGLKVIDVMKDLGGIERCLVIGKK